LMNGCENFLRKMAIANPMSFPRFTDPNLALATHHSCSNKGSMQSGEYLFPLISTGSAILPQHHMSPYGKT
jgi:hypothetical protein